MSNPTGINGVRSKPLRDALRMELASLGGDKGYRQLARALLTRANNGDTTALAMCLDRLDGRVPQPIGGSDELGPQQLTISWLKDSLQAQPANQESEVLAIVDHSATSHQS